MSEKVVDPRFEPFVVTEQRAHEEQSINARQLGVSTCFSAIAVLLVSLVALVFILAMQVIANPIPVAALTGTIILSEIAKNENDAMIVALDNNDIAGQKHFISIVNPFEEITIALINLTQIGIMAWDYFLPFFIMLATLIWDVAVPLVLYLFAAFGNVLIEGLMLLVQLAEIIVYAFADVLADAAGAFGSAPPQSFGGSSTVGEAFRPVTNFLIKNFQAIIQGLVAFFKAAGPVIKVVVNFVVNVVMKYLPVIVKGCLYLAQLFNRGQPLALFLFSIGEAIYGIEWALAGMCKGINLIIKGVCNIASQINPALKKISSYTGIHLALIPSCNINQLKDGCGISPSVPTFLSSAGLCDAQVCTEDVLSIIDTLALQMPLCTDWVANAQSTIQCMNVVYNFSVFNATTVAAASIDTISKELCFVVAATIIAQCNNALPPFGFSYSNAAYQICVADKSGLVPPQQPFNDACACTYAAPLCNAACCNQYSLHVMGQVMSYLGSTPCGTILTQYPEGFWCQYAALNGTSVPLHTDLTFSSDWCAAYTLVIQPACAVSSPTIVLSALDLSVLIPQYSATFCNSTTSQVGVCIPINTETSSAVIQFQFDMSFSDASQLMSTVSGTGFGGAPAPQSIITIPTVNDTPAQIIQKDIEKYYCYYYLMIFNSSNPMIAARQRSVLQKVSDFCVTAVVDAYSAFDFTDQLNSKLRTTQGVLIQGSLIGIPPGTLIFGSVPGLGPSVNSTQSFSPTSQSTNCVYNTAYTMTEISSQMLCTSITMGSTYNTTDTSLTPNANSASDAIDTNTQTMVPVSHVSGLEPPSPNDPNYAQKTLEADQTQSAQSVPTTWSAIPVDQQPELTTNYRTNYVTTADTVFNVRYSARSVLSVKDPSEGSAGSEGSSRSEGSQAPFLSLVNKVRGIGELLGLFRKNAQRIYEESFANIMVHDPHSARVDPLISPERARKGQMLLIRVLRMIDREIREVRNRTAAGEQTFPVSRKLFAMENVTTPEGQISSFWDLVADLELSNQNVHELELTKIMTQRALDDTQYLANHVLNVAIPGIFQYYYGVNYATQPPSDYAAANGFTDGSFMGGGGSNSTGKCTYNPNNPLKCCTPSASPPECCNGIPYLCLPMISENAFPTVTTLKNADVWYCSNFITFGNWWYNTFRVFSTAIASTSLPLNSFFAVFAYPNNQLPPGTIQCMIWRSWPLWVSLAGVWALAVILASGIVIEFASVMIAGMQTVGVMQQVQNIMAAVAIAKVRAKIKRDAATRAKQQKSLSSSSKRKIEFGPAFLRKQNN